MPQDAPGAPELLEAVREFLDEIRDELDGRRAFHARVAANAVGIVARELELGPRLDAAAARRAGALLRRSPEGASARDLEREVARRIRDGSLDGDAAAVRTHVRATVWEKLAIANPSYAPDPPAGAAAIDAPA